MAFNSADAASHSLQLPAGHYVVEVTAPGFLAQTRVVQAADGASLELAFDLEPEPKQWLVRTGIQRIRIEGHTDNRGYKAANLALSKERARGGGLPRQGGVGPLAIRPRAASSASTGTSAPGLSTR